MAAHVEIRLLGGFEVHVDDRVVTARDFERRSGAELVQLLAIAPNRRLHREQVLDRLWPDLRTSSATNALNKAASFARAAIGDRRAVVVRDQVVHLLPDAAVVVDVDVVQAASPDDHASVARARAAYRGDLLPAAPYAPWADRERDRLRLRHLELLAQVGAWEELLELDPGNEPACVQLMRQALDDGDRTAALRRFETFATHLRDELGLDPGPEAVALRDRALRTPEPVDPSLRVRPTREPPATTTPRTPTTADGAGPSSDGPMRPPAPTARPPADAAVATHGRQRESAEVLQLLGSRRLVTLVGPGGIGKTHLATALAGLLDDHADRVAVASLSKVLDGPAALQEVLAALDARRHQDTDDLESITRAVGANAVVLVLDNCEHLLDAVRALVRIVLDACPRARFLTTSRLPLDLAREHVVRLGPLTRDAAVDVFVAEAARQGVVLRPDDPLVDQVCATLDDLPLALRLAAARTRSTDLDLLAATLARNLGVLGEDAVSSDDRTLRETIRWSFDALDERRRAALGAMSAFTGFFSLDGARAVLGDPDEASLLRTVDDLVAASLLVVERRDGSTRYGLLEAIRWYARVDGLDRSARLRHLAHVRHRAEAADALLSTDSGAGLRAFEDVWSDLRLGVATAVELGEHDEGHAILAAVATYANLCLQFDVLEWSERLLDARTAPGTSAHAEALCGWSNLLVHRLELDRAERLLALVGDDHQQRPAVLFARGWLASSRAEIDEADELLARVVAQVDVAPIVESGTLTLRASITWPRGQDVRPHAERVAVLGVGRGPVLAAHTALTAGIVAILTEPDLALDHLRRVVELAERHHLLAMNAGARALQAAAQAIAGRLPAALATVRDALAWTQGQGAWAVALSALATAALLRDGAGHTDHAVRLAAARRSSGYETGYSTSFVHALTDRAREQHPDAFPSWWAAGQGLDPGSATRLGIATIDRVLPSL